MINNKLKNFEKSVFISQKKTFSFRQKIFNYISTQKLFLIFSKTNKTPELISVS